MALSPRDKRAVMIFGGVAGLALVAFLLLKVLGGGGGEETAAPPPTVPGGTTEPSPTTTPKTPRETLPPVLLAGARDPFSPPAVLVSASGGVSPSSSGTGGSVAPSGTGGSTQGPTSSPTAPSGGASSTIGSRTVVLVDIFDSGTRAQIEVDGTVYTVDEGEDFDGNLRLSSISGSCATVQGSGDSATICLNPQK